MLLNDLVYDTVKHLKAQDFDSSLIDFSIETASNFSEEHGILNSESVAEFYVLTFLGCGSGILLLDRKNIHELKFGVAELLPVISACDVVLTSHKKTDERVISQLTLNDLRKISIHDKTFERILFEDLLLIRTTLGLETDLSEFEGVSEAVKETVQEKKEESTGFESLQKVPILKTRVQTFVNEVMAVYDETFSLGYQLDPFVGVIVEEGRSVLTVRKFEQQILPSTLANYLAKAVREEMRGVAVSYERQINLEQVYESNTPIYFPRKIIEFALGYKITDNLEVETYQKIAKRVWRNASKSDNPISSYSHREAIIKHITLLAWELLGIVRDKNDLTEEVENALKVPLSIDLTNLFTSYLQRLKDSLCTFAILKDFSGSLDDWASLGVIISTPKSLQSGNLIRKIYSDVLKSQGKIYPPNVKGVSGCDIYFYTHVVDEVISEAEPLWAYVALQMLQESGESLSKENFLIGRDNNGKILMSSPTSLINLSKHLIHILISGSRSGKGVQTYNQLATTLAANVPVFYGDRKPDTAVELYRIAGGSDHRGTPKGYYVNGGHYDRKYVSADVRDELDWDNGKVAERWKTTTPSFWGINSYTGLLGDMVYLRHIILTLGILILRSQAEAKDPDLYSKLNGTGGVAVVYDEMSNWHAGFMAKYMNSSRFLNNQNLTNEKDLENLRTALKTVANPKSSESKIDSANDVIKKAKEDIFLRGLYLRDLLENLNTTLDVLGEKRDAGFVGSESVYSNVYIIGQQIAFNGTDKRSYTFTKGAGYAEKVDDGDDYLSKFLFSFDADFIMGYNNDADRKNYAWRSVDGSDSKKYLTENARKFAYFEGVTFEQLRKGDPREVSLASENKAVYYKPYLILNSNDWKSESVQFLKKTLGEKFDSVMGKHIQPDGNLHEGIGFEGYIKMMGGNPAHSLIRAREIADMVVRKMGYNGDYLDFLMDLRPEWNFSAKDVWDAFLNPEVYQNRKSFEYWNRYESLINGVSEEGDVEPSLSSGDFEIGYGAMFEELDDGAENGLDNGFVETGGYEEIEDVSGNSGSNEPAFSDVGKTREMDDMGDMDDAPISYNDLLSGVSEDDFYGDDEVVADDGFVESGSISNTDNNFVKGDFTEQETGNGFYRPVGYQEQGFNLQDVDDFQEESVWSDPEPVRPVELPKSRTVRSAIASLAQSLGVSEDVLSNAISNATAKQHQAEPEYRSSNRPRMQSGFVSEQFPPSQFSVQDEFTSMSDITSYVTNRVINDYGGLESVERIKVGSGYLALNGVRYGKRFDNLPLERLPYDKRVHIENKQYAEVFDFSVLRHLPSLSYLSFDSSQFVLVRVLGSLGLSPSDSVFKLFDIVPNLRELKIGSHSFSREEAFDHLAQNESVFFSGRRREQVLRKYDDMSRNFRKSRWDSTKRHWQTSKGREKLFGVSSNFVGTGIGLAMESTSMAYKSTKSTLKHGFKLLGEFWKNGSSGK